MKWLYLCLGITITTLLVKCDEPSTSNPSFQSSSGITTISTDSQTVENLVVLGRVWGFLKYYHPVVASGKFNWDFELFRMIPKVVTVQSEQERNDLLADWIISLGSFEEQDSLVIIDSAKVKLWPDYSWINEGSPGSTLTNKLQEVLAAKRDGKNHYVKLRPGVANPEFINENSYDSLQFPDVGYRLLTLFRYWNMIEYFYPNKHLIDRSWPSVLSQYVPEFVNCKDELEYELCVKKMVAEIDDSHASVFGAIEAFKDYRGRYHPAFSLSFIEGKTVVTSFIDEKYVDDEVRFGDVILSVEGKSMDSICNEQKIYVSSSNRASELRDLGWIVLYSEDSLLHLEVERDGSVLEMNVNCYLRDSMKANTRFYFKADSLVTFTQDSIPCIAAGATRKTSIDSSLDRIMLSRGLILDYRIYPIDIDRVTLAGLLYPERIPFAKYTNTSIEQPGLFTYTSDDLNGKINPFCYKGKVVILVNEWTQSAGEYQALAYRASPNAIVMGSTTAGADGNVSEIVLPGGIKTMISGIGILYPDGRETQRIGIVPDIEIHPTIKGIREGRDELMEAAIEYINR